MQYASVRRQARDASLNQEKLHHPDASPAALSRRTREFLPT
jgi:hypothetical protein